MRNSYELQEVTNRQKFPKNNYFCYRWRVLDNFNKSIDRQMFHLQVQGAGNHSSLLSDKILQLYKARHHDTRKDLIVELAQDAMSFLNRRRHEHHTKSKAEVLLSKATQSLIDRTFSTLLAFSTELNSLLGLSELFITATEPEITKRSNQSATSLPTCIQSHIATSLFRLVIEGRQNTISFYLIPADNILALNDITRFHPIVTWQAQFAAQDQIYWVGSTGVLTEEMVDVGCADLVRILVETTQEAISPKDVYKKTDLSHFDMAELDPWMKESSDVHTVSSEGTRTDSVPSLSSLFTESGHFNAVENAEDQQSCVDASGSHSTSFVASETPVDEQKPENQWTESFIDTLDQVPVVDQSRWQQFENSDLAQPIIKQESSLLLPGKIISFVQEEAEIETAPAFDLKAEYYSDKPAKKSNTNKRSTRKTNSKKNRKKGK